MSDEKESIVKEWIVDPEEFGGSDFPPLTSPEDEAAINRFYNPKNNATDLLKAESSSFNPNDAWIQTYSGLRFTPLNPVVNAIVIQDIAHSLSMQCRFSGHTKKFYSVAQHCLAVSYICDSKDALWGLLHDASEAYLVDVPRPVKHSGKFGAYLDFEKKMQQAICKRFDLPEEEPLSVSKADKVLLYTEARDLMCPLRSDWVQAEEPLPFKIEALPQQEAKDLFMKRFFELSGYPSLHFENYLKNK